MIFRRYSARLAALATAVALIVSCDSRSNPAAPCLGANCDGGTPTPPIGSDNTAPLVDVALGTGSALKDTIVYIGGNLGLSVTASDNIGLASLVTTQRRGAATTVVDSITFAPTIAASTRTFTLDAAALARGDRLVFISRAADASNNNRSDSLVVVVADTATPVATVSSKVASTVRGLDSIDVAVLATDAAGIDSAGVRLVFLRGPADSVTVFSRSARPATRTTSYALDQGFRISDTLPVGQYALIPFAADRSGLASRNVSSFVFTLTDATRPQVTLINPTAAGRVAVGDSVFVRARVTDNAGVASVSFTGFSARGNPALGTADTAIRYPRIVAPASGSLPSTRDTTITRYLKVAGGVLDTLTDSLTVRAIVTDASNNSTTLDLKVALVPTISISSAATGTTLRNGDTLRVRVGAGDTTAVRYYGYNLTRFGATTPVRRDSVLAPAGATAAANTFVFVLPDSIQPGSYALSAFSAVQSAVVARTLGGGTLTIADGRAPTVVLTQPDSVARQAVGDSLLVVVDLADNVGLANVSFRAYSLRGDSVTGTQVQVDRYTAQTAPPTGSFAAGTRTLNVQRYLKVITSPKIDSTADRLIVVATVTDVSGLSSTAQASVQMTNGPKVTLIQPVLGDSITRGTALTVTVNAVGSVGVQSLGFTLRDSVFGTPISPTQYDTVFASPAAGGTTVSYTRSFNIPSNASGILIITPRATDVNGQAGAGTPFRIAVRNGAAPAPLVRQTLAARVEVVDSVLVTATGTALRQVGYSIRDVETDVLIDSSATAASASSFGPRQIGFRIATNFQGKRVRIFSYAIDSVGNVGYSVQPGSNVPVLVNAQARRDTALVVYGQSFSLPRPGIAGDLTVDTIRGNVFISNTTYNRLERWNASAAATNPAASFDATGVAVGSEPWGMVVQTDRDTLLVANSGGTNISKVCIAAACGGIREIGSQRIQTRNTYVFTVTETRDPNTGKILLSATGPISYSDRPQYVQQSAGGRLYYSTKPTPFAPEGTIRYLDPKLRVPDPRQVYQYAQVNGSTTYAIFNSDSIGITRFQGVNSPSDLLTIYDHVYGDTVGGSCNGVANTICGTDSVVVQAAFKVNNQAGLPVSGDVEARNDIDVNRLGLTDTTFVASSGDRSWIGFGEGNSGGTGRVMMVRDTANTPTQQIFFSPGVTVFDLLENASERVFGLAMDQRGSSVAVHGTRSFFAALESPFHLRLQGSYDTFDRGAGIVYHPSADLRQGFISSSPSDSTRTAFVASANGSIEVVDAFNFVSRGTLQIKGSLYGPLRSALPFATDNVGIPSTDPRFIVLKLFGLTSNGLVVINLRAADITPVP